MNQKPRILIVDDEASARDTLAAILFREGYELAFAVSGPEALACLDGFEPDAILLDVMMPGMDGFRVCQRLKTDKRWCHIPIILVTALDGKEDLAIGLEAGADDFVSKPVSGLELRARVRSMLRIKKQHDELEATLRLREDMAHMIVHDMKTPLTAILGFSQLLKRSTAAPDGLNNIEAIETQAHRLNSFLDDMLMLAKMKAGKPVLNCSIVDMNPFMVGVEKNYSAIAQATGIHFVVDLPEESHQISLDANLFQRVLDNLISNALKFSPVESMVTLRLEYPRAKTVLRLQEPYVRIQVLDEGPGIPEEHRSRIFDEYEIVALRKGLNVPQIGLGLAFCKMVVEAHRGHIFVDANEPKGAVFTVEI
jgi:two-component system sensor histidine kinase/response regulator